MKKRLVVANWKMNPDTADEAVHIYEESRKKAQTLKKTTLVVCPPHPYLGLLAEKSDSKLIALGGQNCASSSEGARTGEVSAAMLANIGALYVIAGHSERRVMGETNTDVSEKVAMALRAGLTPILCVGERARDPDGFYLKEISTQLEEGLMKFSKKALSKLVIAYEPVWAIGKSSSGPASPTDVLEMVLYIRRTLIKLFGREAAKVPVLYGGSVDSKNAVEYVRDAGVEGLLVGRESLGRSFLTLLSSVDHV